MKRITAALAFAAALAAQTKVTVRTSGGTYAITALQTAVDDAVTAQATVCAPYVIEVEAGATATVPFEGLLLPGKTCARPIIIRSSRVGEVGNRRVAAGDTALLAVIQNPNTAAGGTAPIHPVVRTVTGVATRAWRFEGIRFRTGTMAGTLTLMAFGDNPLEPLWIARDLVIDRCEFDGLDGVATGVVRALWFYGIGGVILNSRIHSIRSSTADSQGILNAGSGLIVEGNEIMGSGENYFSAGRGAGGFSAEGELVRGNYLPKPRRWMWAYGLSAPAGACVTGSYYAHTAEDYAQQNGGARLVTSWANNGAGLARGTLASHGLIDGDKIIIGNVSNLQINGGWTVTGATANTFDLTGSVWAPSDGVVGGSVTKVTQGYVCSSSAWVTTAVVPPNTVIKNSMETKGCFRCLWSDNRIDGNWLQHAGQSGPAVLLNLVDAKVHIHGWTFEANFADNIGGAVNIATVGGTAFVKVHTDVAVRGNLFRTGAVDGSTARTGSSNRALFLSAAVDSLRPHNVEYSHNTVDNADFAASGSPLYGFPGAVTGDWLFIENLLGPDANSIIDQTGPNGECAALGIASATGTNSYRANTLVGSGGTQGTVICPSTGTWTAANWDVTKANWAAVVATPGTDYTVIAAGYDAHDRPGKRGAYIDRINTGAALAVSGTPIPRLATKMTATKISTTTGKIYYVAPSTSACTVAVDDDKLFASPLQSASDGGGNPARSTDITGMTANIEYWARITCGAVILHGVLR